MVGKNIIEKFQDTDWELVAPGRSELDLNDYQATLQYIDKIKPDYIIHAAGMVGGIEANINNQSLFLTSNIILGQNVISAAKELNIKYLLNISSSCIYPKDISTPLFGDMLLSGYLEPTNEGYALAKLSILKLCNYLSSENPDLHYKTIIPCNLYGCYDNYNTSTSHMIPSAIYKIHEAIANKKDTVSVWGNGNARREYLYAGDLADYILFAIENFNRMPYLINVGSGKDRTVNEYYNIIGSVLGYDGRFKNDINQPIGMNRKVLSIDKQKSMGWKPKTDLKTGIELAYKDFIKRIIECR